MSSNNYNPYNYPYQQSSAQQYSAYQTAPASNNIPQPSRQLQSTPATSQATDYMSYPAQPCNNQGSAYGGTQDNAWGGNTYNGNRARTSQAAEVLRNMSNTAYTTPSNAPVSQPGFTAANVASTSRYSSTTPQGHTHQPAKSHASSSAYGQSQARPRSVNANHGQAATSRGLPPSPAMAAEYPSQGASTAFNRPSQRSASPAQAQYGHTSHAPVPGRGAAMTATSQYNDYSNRQLPNLDATRSTTAATPSYNYGDNQTSTPVLQNQGAITVDPLAVYDPWPEYQRKQDAIKAQKAVEDAARAEEERVAEEARKEEERKQDEQRRLQEEEERSRQASLNKFKQKSRKSQQSAAAAAEPSSAALAGGAEAPISEGMEAEIRALMAKMREFNSKDPAMLARIWEEERRAKAPKSPIVAAKPVAQAPPVAPSAQPTNQRKKTIAARQAPTAAMATPATPIATHSAARPAPAVPTAIASTRGGNTIWPQEKKATLAAAAASHLNEQNPHTPVQANRVLGMLDGNPSYIELCEQLEGMGLKLDRAAFAKKLLTAVPDVNSSSRAKPAHGLSNGAVPAPVAPPAVMKRDTGTPVATPAANHAFAAPSPAYPSFLESHTPPASVAEMVPIRPELKTPANKEEAARKRDFSDLIDLTQMDEDDFVPKTNFGQTHTPTGNSPSSYMDLDEGPATNFPISSRATPQPVVQQPVPAAPHARDLRHADLVEPIDRKKALRRNTYNIKTIARDVLLACGRHPETRQLNQHLEVLRTTLPQIQQDADLSTLRWDIIDPGKPPRGYFRDSVVEGLIEDADNEDSDDKDETRKRTSTGAGTSQVKVQAPPLTEVNPFKRRGRPPRNSFGSDQTTPSTPARPVPKKMSASAPRAPSAGVGYAAFQTARQYDANGNPLPRKRGRPVGWRKNIHRSAEAQAQTSANRHTGPRQLQFQPSQPSTLRNINSDDNEPIRIDSRSPSVPNKTRRYQSFKCKWTGCKAELHNLETLKKHVSKVHRNANGSGFIECYWADCAMEVANQDEMTGMRIEQHKSKSFTTISNWTQHLEQAHFGPLSWELGDGPASGVSDATDSEAYLSDAHGRRVTPKIIARPEFLEHSRSNTPGSTSVPEAPVSRGRGRLPKIDALEAARNLQQQMVIHKKRLGGPGMDRGGATLANEKRRRGFIEPDMFAEELVDAEK